jgi:ribonuclease BN (tRNA processing enzyme)
MRVRMLPSAAGGGSYQFLTTFLVDDRIAIDAGCLGLHGDPRDQVRVRHVFLSHSHADHVCSLPLFVNHVADCGAPPVTIYGSARTLESVRGDIFNGRAWPALERFANGGVPLVRMEELTSGRSVTADGFAVTAVDVDHAVGTLGFIIDDSRSAVAISSDSRSTDEIWKAASRLPHFKAAFIGVAFPNAQSALAEIAGHMTPASFEREAAKLPPHVKIVAIHMKPIYHRRIEEELERLALPNVVAGVVGTEYSF